jgi:hypothetical protein
MATSKVLQTPSILNISGSTVRVAHPDIKENVRYYLRNSILAAGTAATVSDNLGLANGDYLLVGEVGDSKTEEVAINGAITRGTSLTFANTLAFAHDIDTPITKINERKIKLYGAASIGATGTVITSVGAGGVSIQWSKHYTDITILSTDTAYAYYYVTFYDGTTESAVSDYIAAGGVDASTINDQIQSAVDMCNETIGTDTKITREFLLEQANKWQDEVTQYVYTDPRDATKKVKNWPFEEAEDNSSISTSTNENSFALSSLTKEIKFSKTNQAVINIRFGFEPLDYIDPSEMDEKYANTARVALTAQATAGATTVTVDSVAELTSTGSLYIGDDLVTYTAKDSTTNVLSGISASAITTTHAVGSICWQGVNPGMPKLYTIYNGNVILDKPVSTTYDGYKLRLKYYYKLDRFSSFSDTTVIPFYNTLETWLRSRIEAKKGNQENATAISAEFYKQLSDNASSNFSPLTDTMEYYIFMNKDNGYASSNTNGGTRND